MKFSAFFYFGYEFWCRFGVVNFTHFSDFKIDRISIRIGSDVNLDSGSSARSSIGSLCPKLSSACMLMSSDVASVNKHPFQINFAS